MRYSAIEIFHHAMGVLLSGQTIDLSEEDAKRGVDAGHLVPPPIATPAPASPAPAAPVTPAAAPAPVAPAPTKE